MIILCRNFYKLFFKGSQGENNSSGERVREMERWRDGEIERWRDGEEDTVTDLNTVIKVAVWK